MNAKNEMEILKKEKQEALIGKAELNDVELALLIQQVEQGEMLTAPKRLKEHILKESAGIAIQAMVQKNKMSANLQLFLYGMKISAAVVGAIFLIGVINIDAAFIAPKRDMIIKPEKSIAATVNEHANKVSGILGSFADNILNGLE